jgi:hypothetical protein
MAENNYTLILQEVRQVKEDLIEKLDHLEEKIKSEMALKHQAIEFKHIEHDRRLSFTEKILFTTAGFLLLSVLGAIMALVLK